MSTPRFKSKDDYFSKRSNLTERVIRQKPQSKTRRTSSAVIPASVMEDIFCGTVESFEIDGEGRFDRKDRPLEEALASHLDGEAAVRVNPLDRHGMTAWHVVIFSLTDEIQHPFSKAREFAGALARHDIPTLLEVTEGGKGHYHLWILHERPVEAAPVTEALEVFGLQVLGLKPVVVPDAEGGVYVPLPLQYESVLLQRRVFVNTVGKKVKDQRALLEQAGRTRRDAFNTLAGETAEFPVSGKTSPEMKPGVDTAQVREKTDTAPTTAAERAPAASVPASSVESKPAKTEPVPKSVKPEQITANKPLQVVRFRYGDEQYALPTDRVERVVQWHGEIQKTAAGNTASVEGDALPVVAPDTVSGVGSGVSPPVSALLIVVDNTTRLAVPASGVDGIIRVTLDSHAGAGCTKLLGNAVYGESTIGVLDPSNLSGDIGKREAALAHIHRVDTSRDSRRFLTFMYNGGRFAVDILHVHEILPGSAMRRIPGMRGGEHIVAEYNGDYVPVIELSDWIDNEPHQIPLRSDARVVIVSEESNGKVGLRVDDIIGFESVRSTGLRSLPSGSGPWLDGAIEMAGSPPVMIINVSHISEAQE